MVLSLNPCFNGRCTRTLAKQNKFKAYFEGLNPCFNGRCTRTMFSLLEYTESAVLILVLMEDALVRGSFRLPDYLINKS